MATKSTLISLEEFERNPVAIFEQVIREQANVIVKKNDDQIVLRPHHRKATSRITPIHHRSKVNYQIHYEAFLSAAGSWKSFDADTFVAENAEQRQSSPRPYVEL